MKPGVSECVPKQQLPQLRKRSMSQRALKARCLALVQLPDRRCDLPTPQIPGLIPADGHKTDGIGLQQPHETESINTDDSEDSQQIPRSHPTCPRSTHRRRRTHGQDFLSQNC